MNSAERSEIMTADQVAEYLHCHMITVYRMAWRRQIPAFQLGSGWRFRRSDIERWITDREVALDQPAPIKRGRLRRKG